ncbi:MAG: polysaccharide deacetylase family protein [Abditibacteriaceae bacterium]
MNFSREQLEKFVQQPATKVLLFVVLMALIWIGNFSWRPPQLLLGVSHVEHLNPQTQTVALTFDDAPHPLTTPMLLASLKRANVKATFFCVGDNLQMYPQLAYDIVQQGNKLGDHSQNHHNFTTLSTAQQGPEIEKCFALIHKLGGKTSLFRPPGGGLDWRTMRYMYNHNVTLAWWSNTGGDWAPMPAWKIVHHFRDSLRPGDIILLHDAGTSTPQAISPIVREARGKGLRFVLMPEGNN